MRALTRVPAHEIGSRDGVMALLSLRDQFVFLGKAIATYETPAKDPEIAKMLLHLSGPERLKILTSRKTILAGNVKARIATIRKYYEALALAVSQDAAAQRLQP